HPSVPPPPPAITNCCIIVFCLLLGVSSSTFARTTATLGQKSVGQPCGNLASAHDFDTSAQCNSSAAGASGTMQVGPFILGSVTAPPYAAVACDSSKAGMLQWTGSAFQGCDGSTWLTLGGSVNTASNPFSFIDQTGVAFDTTVISNAITLGGFTGQLLAVCNPSCTGMYRNGVAVGMSANFSAGDTIAIQLTSASTGLTPTTASVTLGTTTSATWTVTTNPNACLGTPPVGTRCDDGTIYAGLSPDGFVPMYAAPCDAGMSWNGTSCTGVRLSLSWNDGMANPDTVATGFISTITGRANTAGLAALGNGPSPAPYRAALWCHELTVSGFSDWYLPARGELATLLGLRSESNGFSTYSYWSSTEMSANTAFHQATTSNGEAYKSFSSSYFVRCVRRG
ncbi:MAG: DUF1566 domain-containing protein, partial [Alphaproteobacteria bacterium]|nr:DUF1566 domain-containing protein [Alphaproteobacteria bacterium]